MGSPRARARLALFVSLTVGVTGALAGHAARLAGLVGRVAGASRLAGLAGGLIGLAGLAGCEPGTAPGLPPGDGGGPSTPDGGMPLDAQPGAGVAVEFLDPDHGPFSGGTVVAIRGRGFAPGMTVRFAGRLVEPLDVQVVDARRAIVVTPPGEPGLAGVSVEVGGTEGELPDAFRYEALAVDPAQGSVAGGTFVTVRGFGSAFQDGDVVRFAGAPLVGAQVVSAQEITGYTPPGVAGTVDVTVAGAGGTLLAEDAYTYLSTVDPFQGGLGGGPIQGSLHVTVADAVTGDGVPMAYVALNDPNAPTTNPFAGYANAFGEITFSGPTFTGPLTVTAAKEGYETSSIGIFDARDVTIFLTPIVDPQPGGGFPPGRLLGTIKGYLLFGGPTGIGTREWTLVPEPRRPGEIKVAFVMTSLRNPFSPNPSPGAGGQIVYANDGTTAWPFTITARTGAMALYAVAGLYDPEANDGEGAFTAYALGVTRGILVGPGETLENVPVVVDLPLDSAIRIELDRPPPLDTPGFAGPNEHSAQAFIDLGGEGVISLFDAEATFMPPSRVATLPRMAPLASTIGDASYTVFAGAYTYGSAPYSVRVVRGIRDLSRPVVVGDFLGVPRAVDPADGGVGSAQRLRYQAEAGPTGTATFHAHFLESFDGPVWTYIARGDLFDLPLYDLTRAAGLPPLPTDPEWLYWTIYSIRVPGLDFNQWNYSHLSATYWSAYALDFFVVKLPPPSSP